MRSDISEFWHQVKCLTRPHQNRSRRTGGLVDTRGLSGLPGPRESQVSDPITSQLKDIKRILCPHPHSTITTHTCTSVHMCIDTHRHAPVTHMHEHTHTSRHEHTCTLPTPTSTHTPCRHEHTCMSTHTHMQAWTHMHTAIHTNTHTHMQALTHLHTAHSHTPHSLLESQVSEFPDGVKQGWRLVDRQLSTEPAVASLRTSPLQGFWSSHICSLNFPNSRTWAMIDLWPFS